MKRSEMLIEIYRLLHCGADYPTEDEILDKLEDLGMLPPLVTHNYYNTLLTPPTMSPAGNLDYGFHKSHEWEQE